MMNMRIMEGFVADSERREGRTAVEVVLKQRGRADRVVTVEVPGGVLEENENGEV